MSEPAHERSTQPVPGGPVIAWFVGGSLNGQYRVMTDWVDRYHLIPTAETWAHLGNGRYELTEDESDVLA